MRITKKRSPRLILQSLVKNGCPYIIICIWCVLSGGCVQNKSQDSLKTLKTEIRHIIKDKKATIGVALILDGEDTHFPDFNCTKIPDYQSFSKFFLI